MELETDSPLPCPQCTNVSIQSELNNPPLTSLWSGCVEATVADYPQMVYGKTEAFTILPGLAFRLAGEAAIARAALRVMLLSSPIISLIFSAFMAAGHGNC